MTETKGPSFWATLPGLVTAIAGMITAIAILVTTLGTLPAFKPQESSSPTDPPAVISSSPAGSGDGSVAPSDSPDSASTPALGASAGSTTIPDGQSGLQPLTPALTCDCEEPTWSPDGSQIAYVGPGADGGVVRPILVISASGGSARRLTTNGLAPSWGG